MATNLLYLDDTFLAECSATVQSMGRDDKGAFVVLDRTAAYPPGGGQPADRGYLFDGGNKVPLVFVGFRNGEVLHYVPEPALGKITIGQMLKVQIDPGHRINSARLHTGGHLVSHVVELIEPNLVPIKGYHFSNGSYVEFVNDRSIDVSQLVDRANQAIGEAIAAGIQIRASYSNFEDVQKIRPLLAPFIPQDKPTRIVAIGDYAPLPCGGTHLPDLTQIGAVRITKTKRAKDNTRVSYEVSASAE